MKLIKAHVTTYRNIIDSNPVDINQTTCLVGKNEAGKSAFLKALEGLRSTNKAFKQYGKIENYPRRYLADYDERHPDDDATVITTEWELSTTDIAAVEAALGPDVLESNTVKIEKTYEQDDALWTVVINEEKALENLIKRFAINTEEQAAITSAKTTEKAAKALQALGSRTPSQENLLSAITKFRGNSAYSCIIDIVDTITPQFMYFSHYDRMSGELSINKLNADKQNGVQINSGDRVFLDFLESV